MKNFTTQSSYHLLCSLGLCDKPALETTEDRGALPVAIPRGPLAHPEARDKRRPGREERGDRGGTWRALWNLRAPERHSPSAAERPKAAAASPASGRRNIRGYSHHPQRLRHNAAPAHFRSRAYVSAAPRRPAPTPA